MSRMFDALRRAEGQRRKEATQIRDPQPVVAASERAVSRSSSDGFPPGFMNELGILRNSLEKQFASKERRAILFTSATPGEGTTTITSSFARFLMLQGLNRVLLCEMNAHRPSFANVFSVNGAGVTDYFTSQVDLASLVQSPAGFDIDVLHAGGQDASAIQLHLKKVMPRMLEEAFQHYDTVLIDAPPVISCPETPMMAGLVDGVVMVVQAGKTKRQVVQRSLESIAFFEGEVLGIVLNRKRYFIPEFLYKRI